MSLRQTGDLQPLAAARLAGQTIRAALRDLAVAFTAAGCDSPLIDARLLMLDTLGCDPIGLVTNANRRMTPTEASRLAALAVRRCAREPVARILGARWFYGRPFAITAATLDPRADSETLIEAALALREEEGWTAPLVADIGTGSGCLLITLLTQWSNARGVGTDIAAAALVVAQTNAITHGVADRARWRLGADLEPLMNGEAGIRPFDLIVSNPPYVPSAEIAHLDPDVRLYDPAVALDGGIDGLAIVRRIARDLPAVLAPNGWMLFECGKGQETDVAALLTATWAPLAVDIRHFNDLSGLPRCVAARRRPNGMR